MGIDEFIDHNFRTVLTEKGALEHSNDPYEPFQHREVANPNSWVSFAKLNSEIWVHLLDIHNFITVHLGPWHISSSRRLELES